MNNRTRFQTVAQTLLAAGIGYTVGGNEDGRFWIIHIIESMNNDQVRTAVTLPEVAVDFDQQQGTIRIVGQS